MNANRITYVPDPLINNEPVTKQYGDRIYLTNAGFVMQDNIGMNNHMVTNLGTPTNNTDAATKKYVDDKRCKFKDGTKSISTVDLRDMGLGGSLELYNIITFDGGAYCRDLGPSSVGKEIVNKNTLQTRYLITQQSLSPALSNLFQKAVKKELIVIKGKPTSFTTIYKDPDVNGNPTFTSDSSSVELTVSFNNDLSNGIYNYTIIRVHSAFSLVASCVLLKYTRTDLANLFRESWHDFCKLYYSIKQIDFIFLCVCTVIDHR